MISRLTLAAGVLALSAGAGAAQTLTYATGFPPGSDAVLAAETYAAAMEEHSGGALSVKVFPMSLLSFAETSSGLRDGIADIGWVATAYFPAEYPHINLIAELSLLTTMDDVEGREGLAYAGAMAEYIFGACAACRADFAAQNQVFTGAASSTPYGLQCTGPVASLDALKGKRLRVAGSQWSRWAQAVGATPVSLPLNEVYEGLSQGVIDCVITSAPEITNMGLIDVVKAVDMSTPGGVYAANGPVNMNAATWAALSDEGREAVLRAGAAFAADVSWRYEEGAARALEAAREKGVEVTAPDPALSEATAAFIAQDLDSIATYYAETHGIADAGEIVAAFRPILEKWIGLTREVGSAAELEQLYWDEVYSGVDASTYGQ
ncbi:C4-dicarboxylate TRAP transporter substrate-binding protein [Oceanicella sp. SM1341]|uniref:C4-dicarboxylate TRAP transporter substrate-binding protein n=1 Tax=Oceanicella sp. SM1341 TaxID=1548889 RepID=UPI000E480879|nr:C4-dicarboxylate TRAP transporter substrate-binding protein [Oceanicella sp. SM1341]